MAISPIKAKRSSSIILIPGEHIKQQCPEKLLFSISRGLTKLAYRLPDTQLVCNCKKLWTSIHHSKFAPVPNSCYSHEFNHTPIPQTKPRT